jgi:hypothetical protein
MSGGASLVELAARSAIRTLIEQPARSAPLSLTGPTERPATSP